MSKNHKNPKHLEWVRTWPCALSLHRDCFGSIEAHHLMRPWSGKRGMGMKAGDENAMPLCQRHHIMLHKRGDEEAFFEEKQGSPSWGRATSQSLWYRSPAFKEFKYE